MQALRGSHFPFVVRGVEFVPSLDILRARKKKGNLREGKGIRRFSQSDIRDTSFLRRLGKGTTFDGH